MPQTLEIASEAFLQAQNKAIELKVPLIVCGDTLDTKDIMRAQCVNKIIDLVRSKKNLSHIFLVGNHDMVNEKANGHSLNFLKLLANCEIIDRPTHVCDMYLIPYQASPSVFGSLVKTKTGIILCHQGVQGANMGHYVLDKTSITQDEVAGKRIISGHYHARQDISLKDNGLWSYIGNPYTLSFGEARDPDKGFQILMEDGLLEFISTDLRRHKVIEMTLTDTEYERPTIRSNDIVWVKITGSSIDLDRLNKKELGERLFGHSNFRFDKIPNDRAEIEITTTPTSKMELLNQVIDTTDESLQNKTALKELALELLNEN